MTARVEYVKINILHTYRHTRHAGVRRAFRNWRAAIRVLEREILAPRRRRSRQHTEYHRRVRTR